jgi:hypothetical protein
MLAIFPVLALATISGCAGTTNLGDRWGWQGAGRVTTSAADRSATFEAPLRTAVFLVGTSSHAEIYLSDLPPDQWRSWVDLGTLSGQIVHMTLMVTPRAGRTPVDDEACTATVRQVIFASGQWGVWVGGGFVSLRGSPESGALRATFERVTMRFQGGTPEFVNRLGQGVVMNGSFAANLDEPSAQQLERRLEQAVALRNADLANPADSRSERPQADAQSRSRPADAPRPGGP